MIDFGYRTDVGRVRNANEDSLLILPKHNLFAVADGVGGQISGEVASRNAVNGIEDFVKANPIDSADNLEGKYRENWFRSYFLRCFQKINNDIIALTVKDTKLRGMATTAVSAYIDDETLYLTNVGDSRAYIIRDGEISQLTVDHSYVNKLVDEGSITKSEARIHPQKNVITKAIGVESNTEPDFYSFEIHNGDYILLSTDGLHGELTDEIIRDIVLAQNDLNKTCKKLVEMANNHGGGDNITVVLLKAKIRK